MFKANGLQRRLHAAALATTIAALAATAVQANTNGPVQPHPTYPECNAYPVLNSKGETLYWNFKGYCYRAACAADRDEC